MLHGKRIWIFAVLVVVILAGILLLLHQKPEPIVTAFLTRLYTVEDPALVTVLYEKLQQQVDQKVERKMKQAGGERVVQLSGNDDPFYVHYFKEYGSPCTKTGFEKMLANRSFAACEQAAMRQNWRLEVGVITLDPHTPNQFGYHVEITVTDIGTGEQKTVPMIGIILIKRTILGYKINGIQMQSNSLMKPYPKVF